jgi:hypothetical protein
MKLAREDLKERQYKKWNPAPQRYLTPTPLPQIVFDERVIRVFLSSTFRDMRKERDEFFKNGAPELVQSKQLNK